ncbi:MAG: hypothetical protein P0121_00635 [Nitrospira sp.]|nr:hypothetical protein [Nitrospira sp.]
MRTRWAFRRRGRLRENYVAFRMLAANQWPAFRTITDFLKQHLNSQKFTDI